MGEIEHRRLTLQWNDWSDAHYSVNGNFESGQDLEVVAAEDFDRLAQRHAGAVSDLLTFAQAVLDLPCAFGSEGDPLAAQQRRAADLINAYREQS
jgi:hypothetical protein